MCIRDRHFSQGVGAAGTDGGLPCGIVYYQAGIAVVTASLFGELHVPSNAGTAGEAWSGAGVLAGLTAGGSAMLMTGSEISGGVEGMRDRINNISFKFNLVNVHCFLPPPVSDLTYIKEKIINLKVKTLKFEQYTSFI